MEGCLWKFSVGKNRFSPNNWKERWFVTAVEGLQYFEAKGAKKPKGTVAWRHFVYLHPTVNAALHPEATNPQYFYFAVKFDTGGNSSLLLLRAASERDRERWLSAMVARLTPAIGADSVPPEFLDPEEEEVPVDRPLPSNCRKSRAVAPPALWSHIDPSGGIPIVGPADGPHAGAGAGAGAGKKATTLKSLVSAKKKRFQESGYDLDLTYITPRIIAMCFPSEGAEGVYRNAYVDVERFFRQYHSGHYKVYNLCSERSYPPDHFGGRFAHFPFDDHNAPPLNFLLPFCENAAAFLGRHEKNVLAVHCKAGKGRTGTMIACLLLYTKQCSTAQEALEWFGKARTSDGKGVTIPSQKRYVHYWERMLRGGDFGGPTPTPRPPAERMVALDGVTLHTTPHFDTDGGCDPYLILYVRGEQEKPVERFDSSKPTPPKHYLDCDKIRLELPGVRLLGDVKFRFFDRDALVSDDPMFHFWVHTGFLDDSGEFTLPKEQIDVAFKDKDNENFDPEFAVTLHYRIVSPSDGF